MTVCNFTMFYVQSYIIHFCLCHESSLTVCIDLIFYQCSGVVDGTWYIMPNTTFRLFVIHFVYEYCDHELYNFDEMLYVEDTEVTCYA